MRGSAVPGPSGRRRGPAPRDRSRSRVVARKAARGHCAERRSGNSDGDSAPRRSGRTSARSTADDRRRVSQGAVAAFRARDFDVTLTHFSRALDIAIASNDAVAEAECRRMVALAIVGFGRDDALDACRDALVHVYGDWHWLRIWQLFGSLGLAWAERDVLEPASVVETSDPGASPAGSGRAHRSLRGLSAQGPWAVVGQSAAAPGRRPCPSAVGLEDREPAVASRGPHDKQEAHPAPVA